jgi:hypothetical protein
MVQISLLPLAVVGSIYPERINYGQITLNRLGEESPVMDAGSQQ